MAYLAYHIREQYTADATFIPLENKAWFENSANAWGNYWILYHKRNKEASTVLCSVLKNLGSREKRSTATRVFPYTWAFVLYRFLYALQQNRAQLRLLYLLNRMSEPSN